MVWVTCCDVSQMSFQMADWTLHSSQLFWFPVLINSIHPHFLDLCVSHITEDYSCITSIKFVTVCCMGMCHVNYFHCILCNKFSFCWHLEFLCFDGCHQRVHIVFLFHFSCHIHTKCHNCMWVICILGLRATPEFSVRSEW